ncbi:hypothetical protein A2154_01090 [Candidatus Gottesmanbacteria bacterium RBG_16_43_7]|uniref:Uncharacterized protein n=1 Tax=Candidatus Gottesmanbacteria bacterium RBG_16_43_7 TaxID=1798373 RepID=A0A1F5Z909_9BACT|nr:MAG: hypothetical protein A2154_01090 [Candidatus Gottesmanbacteria bacterium RBG_16_43_7]
MDEKFPDNYSKKLPQHVTVSPNGERKAQICKSGEVKDIFVDVGLWYGSCPVCKETFVYMTGKNQWIVESEFENALQEKPPELSAITE